VDPAVSVVMVTGKGNERLAAQILKEGAREYLTKSAELWAILPEVVHRVIQERQMQRQLAEHAQALRLAHSAMRQKVAEIAELNAKLQQETQAHAVTAAALTEAQAQLERLSTVGRNQNNG
jgi:PleD family two-component response regulator